jgi:hypothetical protein
MPFNIPEPTIQIPPGSYTATLEKVEEFESAQYGTSRRWHWLVEVDGKIESLSTLTSANTGPRSASYGYLTALLGRELKAGESIDDPTGSRVVLQLVNNQKGFPKIDAVLPYVEPQQVIPGVPR